MSPAQGLTIEMRARQAGQGGEFISRNPDAIPPTYLKQFSNCTFEHDAWETEPGARLLEGTIPEQVGTLVQWTPKPGLYRMIAVGRGGSVFKSSDNGSSWQMISAPNALAANRLVVAVECGEEKAGNPRKMILFGAGMPLVIAGDGNGLDPGLADPGGLQGSENLAASGPIPPGDYYYRYTFANDIGETAPSPGLLVHIGNPLGSTVTLNIPLSSGVGCTKRRIYRRNGKDADEPTSTFHLIGEIFDNTTIQYTDSLPPNQVGDVRMSSSNSTKSVHLLSRPPKDWVSGAPVSAFMAEGRLIGFGSSSAAHQLYISSGEDHEDFTAVTRVMPVYPGEGERLVSGLFWHRSGWLFKQPVGVYALDTSSLSTDEWRPIRHTDSVGIAGPLAYTIIEGPTEGPAADQVPFDDVVFISLDGSWHRLTKVGANQEGDAMVSSVSELTYGQYIRANVDLAHLWYAQMIYFGDIQEIQAAVRLRSTPEGEILSNHRIKANLRRLSDAGIRFHHSTFPSCEALTMMRRPDGSRRPFAGAYGQIRELHDTDTHTIDGAIGYLSDWWTHDDSFQELGEGMKLSMKDFHFVALEFAQVGAWPINLLVYIDGALTQRLKVTMGRRGFILDQSRLDVGTLDTPSAPIRITLRLRGRGRRIAFRGQNDVPGRFFSIVNLFIGWSPAGITGGNKLRV